MRMNPRAPGARRRLWIPVLALLTTVSLLPALGVDPAPAGAAEAATVPAGFTVSKILGTDGAAGKLAQAIAVRFAPNGKVLVAQQSGRVTIFNSSTATSGTVLFDISGEVMNFWDRGLLGLAVDPQLTSGRPYVYASYTYDKDPNSATMPRWNDVCSSPPGALTDGCTVTNRISRFTVADNGNGNTIVPGSEKVLLDDWCQQYPSHSIGDVHIGSDGYLYATGGEGASFDDYDIGNKGGTLPNTPTPVNPCHDPANQGGALRAQSNDRAGGPTLLSGTAIRVDPDTGAGVAGNPQFASADANKRRILATGLRNPFRWTFRPGTSEMWIANVGYDDWETIHTVTSDGAGGGVPKNFGWPCYEGNAPQGTYSNIAPPLPACTALYNNPAKWSPPWFAYKHYKKISAADTCTKTATVPDATATGSSISGIAFAPTSGPGLFPAAYRGKLFFADYSRSCIYTMDAGGSGDASTVQLFSDHVDATDLQFGPDGALYSADITQGVIYRIAANGSENAPPVARIAANPTTAPVGAAIALSAAGSTDPEGGPLSYSWDLNGDGVYGDGGATGATTTTSFPSSGVKTVRVRVTDNMAQTSIASTTLTIGTAPVPAITSPTSSTTWRVGERINFSGAAFDANPLPNTAYTWQLLMHHCPGGDLTNCHVHNVQTAVGQTGSFDAPDHDYPSYLELILTVKNSQGISATNAVNLYPRTVNVAFCSLPNNGVTITAGGTTTAAAPFTKTVILGSQFTVVTPTTASDAGSDYSFVNWSDGGAQSHLITANSNLTLTANYRANDRASSGAATGWQYEDIIHADGGAVSTNYNGQPHVFSQIDGKLGHSWYDGGWRTDSPSTTTGATDISTIVSLGQLHVFYKNSAGNLAHSWYSAGWHTEILDPAQIEGTAVVQYGGVPHVFYHRTSDDRLVHTWWDGRAWRRDNPGGAVTANGAAGIAATTRSGAPSAFYSRADGSLANTFWTGATWLTETVDATGGGGDATAVPTGFGPYVFYRAQSGAVRQAIRGASWSVTTINGATDAQGLSAGILRGQLHVFYVDGAGALQHHFSTPIGMLREVLDGPGSSGFGRTQHAMNGQTTVLDIYGQAHIWYHDADGNRLSHAYY